MSGWGGNDDSIVELAIWLKLNVLTSPKRKFQLPTKSQSTNSERETKMEEFDKQHTI